MRRVYWDMTPERVLLEYDGPAVFTFRAPFGLALAYRYLLGRQTEQFIVAPVTEWQVEDLDAAKISLREVLDLPDIWVVDVDASGCRARQVASAPADVLPLHGVALDGKRLPVSVDSVRVSIRRWADALPGPGDVAQSRAYAQCCKHVEGHLRRVAADASVSDDARVAWVIEAEDERFVARFPERGEAGAQQVRVGDIRDLIRRGL